MLPLKAQKIVSISLPTNSDSTTNVSFFIIADYTDTDASYPSHIPIAKDDTKDGEKSIYKKLKIPKTRPQPCDQTVTLYQLDKDKSDPLFDTQYSGCERYVNLVFKVVYIIK